MHSRVARAGGRDMSETLETIAATLAALRGSMDVQFARVDRRFDEMNAQLGGRIDRVDQKLDKTNAQLGARIDRLDETNTQLGPRIDRLDETNTQLGPRIDRLDAKVDRKLDEMNAQLGVKIEAVDEKVKQVYDAVIAQREEAARNAADHERFGTRLDNHDIRLLVLEKRDPAP